MDGKIADRKGYEFIKRMTGFGDSGEEKEERQVQGSLTGARSYAGAFMEALPSSNFISDKLKRNFGT